MHSRGPLVNTPPTPLVRMPTPGSCQHLEADTATVTHAPTSPQALDNQAHTKCQTASARISGREHTPQTQLSACTPHTHTCYLARHVQRASNKTNTHTKTTCQHGHNIRALCKPLWKACLMYATLCWQYALLSDTQVIMPGHIQASSLVLVNPRQQPNPP